MKSEIEQKNSDDPASRAWRNMLVAWMDLFRSGVPIHIEIPDRFIIRNTLYAYPGPVFAYPMSE